MDADEMLENLSESTDNTIAPVLPVEIKKEILVAAPDSETRYPTKGDDVTVHYVGTLASDGSKFDSSRDRKDPFKFKLGLGQVIKGWDLGVASMRKGEKAVFTLPSEYAYGAGGSPPKIPGGATLVFEVELLSFGSEVDLFFDGGVIKNVLTKSNQYKKPKIGDEVVFSYNLSTDKSLDSVVYTVGNASSLADLFLPTEVLDKFLIDMKVGEVCSIDIRDGKYTVDGNLVNGTVTLSEVRSLDDCSIDLGTKIVCKKTMKKGDSFDCPTEYSTVRAEVCIRSAQRVVLAKQMVSVVPGSGRHSEALEAVLVRIVPNEEVLVTTTVDDAWIDPSLGIGPLPFADTVMEIKLVEYTKAPNSWELKGDDKIARLATLKEAGGSIFKSGRIRFALSRYTAAARLYEHDKEITAETRAVLRLCLLNEAMCQLKLGEFRKAEQACSKVLKDESQNIKALYRRAQALFHMGEFNQAHTDLKRVAEIEPTNADARTLMAAVKTEVKKANDQMKGLYTKMMSKK